MPLNFTLKWLNEKMLFYVYFTKVAKINDVTSQKH